MSAVISSLKRAFSDFHLTIDDHAVNGDTVWLRMTGTGTNYGSFMGHPPTGRPMRTDVFDALRFEDDRIVEHWGIPDRLGTLFQLGLAAPPSAVPRSIADTHVSRGAALAAACSSGRGRGNSSSSREADTSAGPGRPALWGSGSCESQ